MFGVWLKLLCSVAVMCMGGVDGNLTMDHGQFHKHEMNENVRDYKTGGPLTIHVCPHSHDDVGWLKTID